jgi:hypothetical protein
LQFSSKEGVNAVVWKTERRFYSNIASGELYNDICYFEEPHSGKIMAEPSVPGRQRTQSKNGKKIRDN